MPRPGRNFEKSKDFKGSIKRFFKSLDRWKVLLYFSLLLAMISSIIALIAPNKLSDLTDEITAGITPNINEEVIKDINLGVAEFDTMNPILSQNKHVQEISRIIYEPLFELDGEYKLKKCLASDWAKTSPTTYLIKIQKTVEISKKYDIICIE